MGRARTLLRCRLKSYVSKAENGDMLFFRCSGVWVFREWAGFREGTTFMGQGYPNLSESDLGVQVHVVQGPVAACGFAGIEGFIGLVDQLLW